MNTHMHNQRDFLTNAFNLKIVRVSSSSSSLSRSSSSSSSSC